MYEIRHSTLFHTIYTRKLFILNILFNNYFYICTELVINRFVHTIILYLKNSTTNEVLEHWDFVVECAEHNSGELNKYNDLSIVQKEIRDLLQQICSMKSYLPVSTWEWKYSITVKLEEPLRH